MQVPRRLDAGPCKAGDGLGRDRRRDIARRGRGRSLKGLDERSKPADMPDMQDRHGRGADAREQGVDGSRRFDRGGHALGQNPINQLDRFRPGAVVWP